MGIRTGLAKGEDDSVQGLDSVLRLARRFEIAAKSRLYQLDNQFRDKAGKPDEGSVCRLQETG